MNINTAIKVLENEIRVAEVNDRPYDEKAFRLGVEALKWFRHIREADSARANVKLPGETKE